ncbi:MAG: septum formation protein Maf [Sedimentisphaerales bacterium]|nr:septum formation protein Maf [Sedimentisphaerales bacterium]
MATLAYPLILASASPRRQELLHQAGYSFTVAPCRLPEPAEPADGVIPAAWAESLAYFKARCVANENPAAIVIGADTIVARGATIIGKPVDQDDARRILTTMFAGRNDVITGLAIIPPVPHKRIITSVTSTIVMRPMTDQELEEYLAGGVWRDKAGAYAFQEGGDKFVQSLQGSVSNIVGLPCEKLQEILQQFAV